MPSKIVKISLIILGVPALFFVGLVIYEMTIELEKPLQEAATPEPSSSEEVKKPTACLFTREPEEFWLDETADDPPIGNVELIKNFHIETYDVFGSNLYEVVDSIKENGPDVRVYGKGAAAGTEAPIIVRWYKKIQPMAVFLPAQR